MDGKYAIDERQPQVSSIPQHVSTINPETASDSRRSSVPAYIPATYLDPQISSVANVQRMVTNLNASSIVANPNLVQQLIMQQAAAQQRHDGLPPFTVLRNAVSQPNDFSIIQHGGLQSATVAQSLLQSGSALHAGTASVLQDNMTSILQAGMSGSPNVLFTGFPQTLATFNPLTNAAVNQQFAAISSSASQFFGAIDRQANPQFSVASMNNFDVAPNVTESQIAALAHAVPIAILQRSELQQQPQRSVDSVPHRRETSFETPLKLGSHDAASSSEHVLVHSSLNQREPPADLKPDLRNSRNSILSHHSAFSQVHDRVGPQVVRSNSVNDLTARDPSTGLVSGDAGGRSGRSSPSTVQSHAHSARSTPSMADSSHGAHLTVSQSDAHGSPQSGPTGSHTSRSVAVSGTRRGGIRHSTARSVSNSASNTVIVTTGPNGVTVFQCSQCGKQFTNSSAIAKHKLTHSDERRYVCSLCSKAFKRQDHLNGHMLTHQDKKPHQCTFPGCAKSYSDARSLRRHLEHQHQNDIRTIISNVTEVMPGSVASQSSLSPNVSFSGATSQHEASAHAAGTNWADDHRVQAGAAYASSKQMHSAAGNGENSNEADKAENATSAARLLEPSIASLAVRFLAEGQTPPHSEVLKHLDELHPQQCSVCRKRFKNQAALNGHMRLHGGFAGLPVTSGRQQTQGQAHLSDQRSHLHDSPASNLHLSTASKVHDFVAAKLRVKQSESVASEPHDSIRWLPRAVTLSHSKQRSAAASSAFAASASQIDNLIAAAEMMDENSATSRGRGRSALSDCTGSVPQARTKSDINEPSSVRAVATAGSNQELHTVDTSLDREPERAVASSTFGEVEIAGVADIVDADLFNSHDDLVGSPVKSSREKHEATAVAFENDLRKRRLDEAMDDEHEMMASAHFEHHHTEYGALECATHGDHSEPTLWQCVSLGQRGVGVRSPSGTVYKWTPPSSRVGYNKPHLLLPQSHWQLTTALNTANANSGPQRIVHSHCADTITVLALKNVFHTVSTNPTDDTWRKRHYSAADIFADELDYSLPPTHDPSPHSSMVDSLGQPLLVAAHSTQSHMPSVDYINVQTQHQLTGGSSSTPHMHSAGNNNRHSSYGGFNHQNHSTGHDAHLSNGASNDMLRSSSGNFNVPASVGPMDTTRSTTNNNFVTTTIYQALSDDKCTSTSHDVPVKQKNQPEHNAPGDLVDSTGTKVQEAETTMPSFEQHAVDDDDTMHQDVRSKRHRPGTLHIPLELHDLASSLAPSFSDNWHSITIRTRRPSFGYRSCLRKSIGGTSISEWNASSADDLQASAKPCETASRSPPREESHQLKSSKSLFTPPPILSPFRSGPGLFWNAVLSKSRHASNTSDAPPLLAASTNFDFEEAHAQLRQRAASAVEVGNVVAVTQLTSTAVPVCSTVDLTAQSKVADVDLTNTSEVSVCARLDSVKEANAIVELEAVNAIETDPEPHINVGSSYQATLPVCRPQCEALTETSPPEQLLLDPAIFASITDETLEAYLETARSAVLPGNGVNTELALRVLVESNGVLPAALEVMMNAKLRQRGQDATESEVIRQERALVSDSYAEIRVWSPDDIASYNAAFKQGVEKEFCELARLTGRSVKECVEFYYVWKKAFPDEYARMRRVRRRKEKAVEVCGYNLRSDSNQIDDTTPFSNTVQPNATAVVCVQCDATFTSDSALRRHMASVHRGMDAEDDNDASQTCDDVSTLNEDLETLDDASSSFDGTLSNEFDGAAKPFSITDESATHSHSASDRLYPSDFPGRVHTHHSHRHDSFFDSDAPSAKRSRKHTSTSAHRAGPFTCKVCGRQFEKVKSCNAHMKSHSQKYSHANANY